RPNACQIRLTALWLIPVAAAIERLDQCVASTDCSSSVFTIISSTASWLIRRGLSRRGSSPNTVSARRGIPALPSAMSTTLRRQKAGPCGLAPRDTSRMCGICGVVQIGGHPREVVHFDVLERMTDVMTHRGPNDRGFHVSPGVAFGVRRLSIID